MIEVASYPPMKFGYLQQDPTCPHGEFTPDFFTVSCKDKVITIDKIRYRTVVNLLKDHPAIKEDLVQLARAINFFANGCDFKVITKPAEFKKTYEDTIQYLSSSDEDQQNALFDELRGAGIRDTKHISEPHYRKDGTFVFYAEKAFVPYRISCRFSKGSPENAPKIKCEMVKRKEPDSPSKQR